MAKATLGAGLSALQGKIGGLCGKVINGRQQIGRLSTPYSISGVEPTVDQTYILDQYALTVRDWRAASVAQQTIWNALGALENISGFDWLVRQQCAMPLDRGLTWTLSQRLGTETQVRALANLGGGVCLAGTIPTGQVWRSTDGGLTWTLSQRLGTETYVLALANLGGGVCLAGTYPTGRVWRSTDGGLTWTLSQRLGTETYVYALANLGGGVCLASTYPTGQVWRSTDGGLTWTLSQRLGTENYVFALANLGGGVCLAGTYPTGQVWRSTT